MVLNLKLFFALLFIGLIIDYLWIGVIAKNFYLNQFGDLARLNPDGNMDVIKWAGLVVYFFIVTGLLVFVLPKVSMGDPVWLSLGYGFLMGIIIYGVYDYTNYATVAKWPFMLCIVDVLWGGILCALLSGIGKYLRDSVF